MAEREPILDREELITERKKIISNLVLLMAAFFVAFLALGTLAWFRMNKIVSGEGVSVFMNVPDGVQISLGRTGVNANGAVSDRAVNDPDDLLWLEPDENGENWKIVAPRNNEDGDAYDWSEWINVSNYYTFGKLIPASSVSGENILFTPDAVGNGRKIITVANFYLANGKTDGDLKAVKGKLAEGETDGDGLMTTVHVYRSDDGKNDSFWNGYRCRSTWYDTNDDGYYVDIPLWFRTNSKVSKSLKVDGFITKKDGSLATQTLEGEEDPDSLYKAVRVALLVENGDGSLIPAVPAKDGFERNIIPLQNAVSYGETGHSIVDSKNYTVTRDTDDERDDEALYGIQKTEDMEGGVKQSENYAQYYTYGAENASEGQNEGTSSGTLPAVLVLAAAGTSENDGVWSETSKVIIRIWLDGDDQDCWNETAGQDFSIHLRFSELTGSD